MGSGRKRIEFRKIEKLQNRRVTFTKRRQGLIKKAEQLSSLTGCRVAALFFSPSCLNPILYGDISLLEQAAAAAAADADSSVVASIHRHSTTTPASLLFADCFQEQSPSVGGDNLVDQESLLLLTTAANYEEERCRRQEFLHQMDLCKPLQMVVPTIENSNNYHYSASSSYYYSNIEKNNNCGYGAGDQMKMVTFEVGSSSSSRRNTTSRNNTNLVQSDQLLLLSACEEDQEEEWLRKELLQMDDHSGSNNIQNNYNYHYSYSSPFSCTGKNNYGAGGRDQMKMVTREVGSSSRINTTDINNNNAIANGLMSEEAQQQQQLTLAGDDLADSLCMAREGADLNQLKQSFQAVRQSLLDKLMMADAALSLLS